MLAVVAAPPGETLDEVSAAHELLDHLRDEMRTVLGKIAESLEGEISLVLLRGRERSPIIQGSLLSHLLSFYYSLQDKENGPG
jgi:hypothetical protein